MESCPSDEMLQRLLNAQLDDAERARLDAHVADCSACAELIAHLGAQLALTSTDHSDEPAHAPAGAPLPPGTRVDRYVIAERVGSGGMGDVYAARDPQLDRPVALKLLRRGGHALERRLLREAQAMAKLDHPNVVPIFDAGKHDEQVYVAMAFVRGPTLRGWLREPRDWRAIVALFRQAGEGLAAAHAAGIIHRDFKPDNVLVDEQGRPRVADFGLARTSSDQVSLDVTFDLAKPLTRDGTVLGTPAYMPPEQIEGGSVDARADLFSFCVALWEALYGTPPFAGTTLGDRLAAIRRGELVSVATAKVPRWLRDVIARGLHADPARRPASMRALLDALGGGTRRPRTPIIAAGGVVAVAGVVATVAMRGHAQPWRAEIRDMPPAYEENAGSIAISPDGTQLAFTSDRDQPERGGRIYVGSVRGGPSHAITPAGTIHVYPQWSRDGAAIYYVDLATWIGYRVTLADRSVTELARDVHDVIECGSGLVMTHMASPDCPSCQRYVLHARDGSERELVRGRPGDWLMDIRCDRSGSQLVFAWASGGKANLQPPSDIWTVAVAGAPPRRITNSPELGNRYPTWAPDGRSIVYSASTGDHLSLWEIATAGGTPRRLTSEATDATGADITPDGSTLIYNLDTTSTPIIKVDPTGGRQRIAHTQAEYADPQGTPDGSDVIASVRHGLTSSLVTISLATADERVLADAKQSAVSRDGAQIVFVPSDDTSRLMVIPRGGGAPQPVAQLPGLIDILATDSDGIVHMRIRHNGSFEAWRVALRPHSVPERELPAPWCLRAPGPRGGWTAVATCQGIDVHIHLQAPGAALPTTPGTPIIARGFAWDPDGGSIVYTRERTIRRYDLVTGQDTQVTANIAEQGVATGPDHAIYATELVGHVHRRMIVNFGARSRI